MKKMISFLSAAAMLAAVFTGCGTTNDHDTQSSSSATKKTDYIYGTMQIPYDDFYVAEGVAYEVDAVSSATSSKWKNEELAAGTYHVPHTEDEGGDILGVVYPVAIAQEDLDALGEENYGFTALESEPDAYKIVTVTDGDAEFSAVQGGTNPLEAEVSLSTDTAYGDYVLDVSAINNSGGTSDIGVIYGVMVKTTDGAVYAMRHLENIWLDELAWSVGFVTEERHGNILSSEDYADMMGKTICEIVYITETGYHVLSADLYMPIKFDGGVEVAGVPLADGTAAMTMTGLPEEYSPAYEIEGLHFEVVEAGIRFTDALPGSYTLVITDENGKYAELRTSFILSTDTLPIIYNAESNSLEASEGADAALVQAFLSNISKVAVNGTEYNASGRGAAAIITKDGVIDTEASVTQGHGAEAAVTPVFAESGTYELTVESVGFDQTIRFSVNIQK